MYKALYNSCCCAIVTPLSQRSTSASPQLPRFSAGAPGNLPPMNGGMQTPERATVPNTDEVMHVAPFDAFLVDTLRGSVGRGPAAAPQCSSLAATPSRAPIGSNPATAAFAAAFNEIPPTLVDSDSDEDSHDQPSCRRLLPQHPCGERTRSRSRGCAARDLRPDFSVMGCEPTVRVGGT